MEAKNGPTRMNDQGQRIAVIGGGVAGIVVSDLLQRRHEITLFEQNDYLGGHTHTIEIPDGPDAGTAIDTGFIVLNNQTYPLFQAFLRKLNVGTRVSEMSFGFHCRQTGLTYAGTNLRGLFAQRCNLLRPTFYRFLGEIVRFCNQALRDLEHQSIPPVTLGEYLSQGRYSTFMIENYLMPMAAAIWSSPSLRVAEFPAAAFLHFFRNHGLLSMRNRPIWQTVSGGSFAYVKAFLGRFQGRILLNTQVHSVRRESDQVLLELPDGKIERFDQVVIAAHADQALRLLENPFPMEQRLLGAWRYQKNHTVLHTDSSLMPKQRQAWAAWNFAREGQSGKESPVLVTYSMNRLQGLSAHRQYFVTLNRQAEFAKGTVVAEMDYHHPLYSFSSMNTQSELPLLNGQHRTFYCGSYFGYGFHEDAVRSAMAVAETFGVGL